MKKLWILGGIVFIFVISIHVWKQIQYRNTHATGGQKKVDSSAAPLEEELAVDTADDKTIRVRLEGGKYIIDDTDLTIQKEGNRTVLKTQKPIEYRYFTLDGDISLPSSITYPSKVIFQNCNFNDSVVPSKALFSLDFFDERFLDTILFAETSFHEGFSFTSSRFEKLLDFSYANSFFNKDCGFTFCKMMAGVRLPGQHQSILSPGGDSNYLFKTLYFIQDTILGKLDLSNTRLTASQKLIFSETFVDSLDLSFSNLVNPVDLTAGNIIHKRVPRQWMSNAVYKFILLPYVETDKIEKTKINLTGTSSEKIKIDYHNFQLYFDSTASNDEKNAVYQGLLDNFKKNGESENYRLLDIEYHDFQAGFFNFFSKYWWNYGYSKWLIFIWSAIFVIVFSVFNYKFFLKAMAAYKIESINSWFVSKQGRQWQGTFWSGMIASILYTGAIFFGVRLDFEKFNFKHLRYAVFILFQFLLGLVCTAFIIHLIIG